MHLKYKNKSINLNKKKDKKEKRNKKLKRNDLYLKIHLRITLLYLIYDGNFIRVVYLDISF